MTTQPISGTIPESLQNDVPKNIHGIIGGTIPQQTSTGGGAVNPTQNPNQSQTTGVGPGGLISANISQTMTPQQVAAYNPFGDLSAQTNVATQTSEVDPATQTVEGRVESLLAQDNDLMRRARAVAAGQMNQRGLVNSTMGVQAGTAAMIDKALPIASQDAAIYSDRAMFNTEAINQGRMFNAAEINKLVAQGADIASRFGLQQNEFKFQSGENALNRATDERLANAKIASDQALAKAQIAHDAAMTNLKLAADAANTDKSIAAQERLMKAQQEFQGTQAELDRLQQTNLQLQDQMFRSTENELDRQAQTNILGLQQAFTGQENALDRENQRQLLQLQTSLNNSNIPKAQTAEIVSNLARDISTIAASPDMDANAKTVQIKNLYDAANASIQTISTLYNTELVGVGNVGTIVPNPTQETHQIPTGQTVSTPYGNVTVPNSPRIPQ